MPIKLKAKGTGRPDYTVITYRTTHSAPLYRFLRYTYTAYGTVSLEAGKYYYFIHDLLPFENKDIYISSWTFELDKNVLCWVLFGVYDWRYYILAPIGGGWGYGKVEVLFPIPFKIHVYPDWDLITYFRVFETNTYDLRINITGLIEEITI